MRWRRLRRRAWPALVSGGLILAAGQSGNWPVPSKYLQGEEHNYRAVAAAAARDAPRAHVIVLGDSRIMFSILAPDLAAALRLPGQRDGAPVVASLATLAGDVASDLWLWRRIAGRGPGRARVLIVGISEAAVMSGAPGRDLALRYQFRAGDAVWLIGSGRLGDAAALLTYRAFPLYARRQSMRNLLRRQERPAMWRRPEPGGVLRGYYRSYRTYRVDPFQVRCLEQLIRAAQGAGVQVILVAPPIQRPLLAMAKGFPPPGIGDGARLALPNRAGHPPLDLLQEAVLLVAARLRVPYLDYLTFRDSARFEYWDPSHLAPSPGGARRFTREVAAYINDHLADSRPTTASGAR